MVREVEETHLPGVGVRFSFTTGAHRRLTVLIHHSGRRDIFIDVPGDPDQSRSLLELDEDDSRVLADLLGGSRLVHDVDRLQRLAGDLALDWLRVGRGSLADGRTIGQLQIRSTIGVSIVAVLRSDQTIAAPGPDVTLQAEDTAVVVGNPDNIRRAQDLLRP